MTEEQEREAFEELAVINELPIARRPNNPDLYIHYETGLAWYWWQARATFNSTDDLSLDHFEQALKDLQETTAKAKRILK